MAAIDKVVYVGRDNPIDLEFSVVSVADVATLRNFTGAYSVTLSFVGVGATATIAAVEYTALTAGNVADISLGSGVLRLRLGLIPALIAGTYRLRAAYKTDVSDTGLTQLVHEYSPDPVVLRVVAV